jgi:hypothetical protein
MLDLLARFISFVFNPYFLIIPIPYLLVVRQTGNPLLAIKWLLFSFCFLLAVGVSILVAVKMGYFSDLDISKREQRPKFFLLLTLFSCIYFLALSFFKGPLTLFVAISGIFLSILVFSFVNTRIKVSIHVASITALLVSFSLLYSGIFLLLLFLIPLIGWSRLRVHRHTREEVLAGAALGIAIPLVMFMIFKVLLQVTLTA